MDTKNSVALTIAISSGGALQRRETITAEIVKIGRDAKSHVRVDDELCARMHAVLEVAGSDNMTLIDLGNEAGTLVNGKRVNKCRIGQGDVITIGDTCLAIERVESVAAASATPPRASATSNPFTASLGDPSLGWNNPFAAPAAAIDEVAEDAPEGSYTYALVKSAPDVPSSEVELPSLAVEVMILWGESVLCVEHLTPPRSFYVGEEERKNLRCDFFLPADKLGTTRAPVVLSDGHGSVDLVIPAGATGWIELEGQPRSTLADVVATGRALPCAELSGAHQTSLPARAKAHVEIAGMVFKVSTVNAGRVVAGHFQLDTQAAPYHGLSALVHVGLLAAAALFMPPLSASASEDVGSDQQHLMGQYLAAAAMRDLPDEQRPETVDDKGANDAGGTGTKAIGESGKMGSTTSTATNKRYAVKENYQDPDPRLARQAALHDAGIFGMIGILNNGAGGDPKTPTAPWGGVDAAGKDPISALGNMWGAELGDAAGLGGLGLTGIGEGGGGSGLGVGMGSVGTLGHGSGLGDGQDFGNGPGGFGRSIGRLQKKHDVGVPKMRVGTVAVGGHLPPEVIQRVVRQNFGRFRFCYENGLRNNPNLAGRVGVRFVIGRDGAVSNVGNGGSDMPDAGVVSCVVRAFYGLSFPQPDEGGIVTVVYPIMFSPGG